MELKKYWLEAGSILYFEKQPEQPHIPRRGEWFVSQDVYKATDVDAALAELQKQLDEAKCGEALCGHDHSTQYWELRANKAEHAMAAARREAMEEMAQHMTLSMLHSEDTFTAVAFNDACRDLISWCRAQAAKPHP